MVSKRKAKQFDERVKVFVCGDSHTDVWRLIRDKLSEDCTFVINRLQAISAQGLGNPSSKLQAAHRFRRMIQDNREKIDFLVLMVGFVDLEFVLFFKQARGDRVSVEDQIEISTNALFSWLRSIEEDFKIERDRIVVVGIHPPTVADNLLRERLNKEFENDLLKDERFQIPDDMQLPSLKVRTERIQKLNTEIYRQSLSSGYRFLSILDDCVNPETGTIWPSLRRQGPLDIHLDEHQILDSYIKRIGFLLDRNNSKKQCPSQRQI